MSTLIMRLKQTLKAHGRLLKVYLSVKIFTRDYKKTI